MNYLSIIPASAVDFQSGWSTVLQVAGCAHKCHGCFSPCSWNPDAGHPFDEEAREHLYFCLGKPYIDNLVLQGGDPLFYKNVDEIIDLCNDVRDLFPTKRIVLFTGYTFEQVQRSSKLTQILPLLDVMVDGRFVQELRDSTCVYKGSTNQRIINVSKSLDSDAVVLYTSG